MSAPRITVCGGAYVRRRRILPCWGRCDGKRRRVVWAEGSPWYGPTITCCACGDKWDPSEGHLYGRPFERGWRARAIAKARAQYIAARSGPILRDEDFYPIPDES